MPTITFNTDSGYYECWAPDCKGSFWCEHIQAFIASRGDASIWWRQGQGSIAIDPLLNIHIPIVPSLDLWRDVRFFETEYSNRLLVKWRPPFHPENAEAVFLTFFNEGEGLGSIREVLFQQMYSEPGWDNRECESPVHGYPAQVKYEKDMRTRPEAPWQAQRWSIFTEAKCYHCLINQFQPDPDLVPPMQGTPWSS